jgi:hypothetical protein
LKRAVLPAGLVTMINKVMCSPFNSPVIAIILKIYLLCSPYLSSCGVLALR